MNISFSPLLSGNSGTQAPAEPGNAAQSVEAFLLLMGADPDAVPPLPVEMPSEPEIAVGSTAVSEDDLAAKTETDIAATLPMVAVPLFPQAMLPSETGSGDQSFVKVSGLGLSHDPGFSRAIEAALGVAPVPAPQMLAPRTDVQTVAPAPAPQIVKPETIPQFAAPDPVVRPTQHTNPDVQTPSNVIAQTRKADAALLPHGLAAEIPTAPVDVRAALTVPRAWPADPLKADTKQPLTMPLVDETLKTPPIRPSLPSEKTQTKVAPALTVPLAHISASVGDEHVIATAQQDVAPKTAISQPGMTAQPLPAQPLPGFVLVSPRMPVQDTPVSKDAPAVDTTAVTGPSVTKTDEGRTTVAPAINSKGDSTPLPLTDLAAPLTVEVSGEPGQLAPETGPLGPQPAVVHQTGPAQIDRATETPAIRLADLAATISRAATTDAAQSTTLQLDPIELGTVAFNMDTGPSGLIVTITAERPETLDLLRRNADQFISDLRQSGFLGASLQFSQSGGGHLPQQDQPAHRYAQGAGDHAHTGTAALETASQTRRHSTGQALDLRL